MEENNYSHIFNHLGEERENYFNAVAPPIIMSSNFCYKTIEDFRNAALNEKENPLYSRGNNPTIQMLCDKVAALEGAEDALITSSGSAAVALAVMSCLKAGDHVVSISKPYSWSKKLLSEYLTKFGVSVTFCNGNTAEDYEAVTQDNTKLYFMESPNSWTFETQDLEGIANAAKKRGIKTIIDNSYCTALCQRPMDFGIDLVVYSATKYYAGHSDTVCGIIAGNKEDIAKIFRDEFMTLGAIISPFNAWLMLRSLRTLEIRVEKSAQNAQKVINYLLNHKGVAEIYYPHHPKKKDKWAEKYMKMPMGMFSFELNTKDEKQISTFCESLKLFLMAVSWGSYESLIMPFLAVSGYQKVQYYPLNLIRVSIGLENADDLIADLKQAFEKAGF